MFISESTIEPAVKIRRLAIAGNPNSGKTTIFNALTGLHQKVGNYPGVTVEHREGLLSSSAEERIRLVDLPGAYSMVSRSLDERVMRDVLLGLMTGGEPIDGVIVVVDGSNLERHLYLATQIIDLGYPTILCLNMMDLAQRHGLTIDTGCLQQRLGVPVVETVGFRQEGIAELRSAAEQLKYSPASMLKLTLPAEVEQQVNELAEQVQNWRGDSSLRAVAIARLLLASVAVDSREVEGHLIPLELAGAVDQAVAHLTSAGIVAVDSVLVQARYGAIRDLYTGVVQQDQSVRKSRSDRVDRVLTHPLWGGTVFVSLMFVMFMAIFSWATPLMDGIEAVLGYAGEVVTRLIPEGTLQSLLVDGVIGGVGSVVVFLPQIWILFFFVGLLEDTGYMARAALLMNRLMNLVGLPGKSFIPLLSGYACAIPGIMAARTIENRRDRLVTILVVPLMSCSARLPVYLTVIGAIFAGQVWVQSGALLGLYVLGTVMALGVAWLLKRTMLQSPPTGLLIELPPYHRPNWGTIIRSMWERSVLFLKGAGSIIFAVSVVLWALAYFPQADPVAAEADPGLQLRQSYMGRMGQAIAPVIEPLGYDWKIGVGLVASFAAREVFVSTMGIVYGVGDEVTEEDATLREKIAADTWPDGRKVYTPLAGLSLLVFYVIACQCVSTLAIIKRETNSWRWPVFTFVYMTVLAYGAALITYQVGSSMGWGV
ncbi:MAG: Fe(2+) transporter FeoB [Phycisphaerae bacterium]|nr:Fe(2+) transporter FeoB [Phycisphaerae bacterium]